jgi:hypothetical protein
MAEPRRPYYVSFTIDRIPQTVDHSQSNPGGAARGAERAGHTSVRLSPSGGPEFVPYTGRPGPTAWSRSTTDPSTCALR